jgi:predicted CXXCH cytochrome family protein
VVVVDGGNLFWKSKRLPETQRAQRVLKAEAQAELLMRDGLDVFVPGPGDLALGEDLTRLVETYNLPLFAGNLQCGDQSFPGSVVLERGGHTIGVVAVTSATSDACALTEPPLDAVKRLLPDVAGSDVVLVVGHVGGTFAKDAGALGVDFVLDGTNKQLSPVPSTLESGGVQVSAGSRGKALGVLTWTWVDGGVGWTDTHAKESLKSDRVVFETRLDAARDTLDNADNDRDRSRAQSRIDYFSSEVDRVDRELAALSDLDTSSANHFTNELLELSDKVGEDTAILARLETLEQAVADAPKITPTAPTAQGPYVGSSACKVCHVSQSQQWQTTPHASAWASLMGEGKADDESCFSCHVTGGHHPAGPQSVAEVGPLKDVGCESCHGPGRAHVASPSSETITSDPPQAVCVQCHDGEQDQGDFDWATYRPQVVHSQ